MTKTVMKMRRTGESFALLSNGMVERIADLPGATIREPKSWFSLEDNFAPSIHVVDQALTYRMTNPDGPLPPPSEHITKYLAPPSFVQERLTKNGMLEKAIKAFDVKQGSSAFP